MAYPQPPRQHVPREFVGGQSRQRGVEGQLGQDLDAQLLQPVGARLGIHKAEGRGVGCEELAWMRLEGNDT